MWTWDNRKWTLLKRNWQEGFCKFIIFVQCPWNSGSIEYSQHLESFEAKLGTDWNWNVFHSLGQYIATCTLQLVKMMQQMIWKLVKKSVIECKSRTRKRGGWSSIFNFLYFQIKYPSVTVSSFLYFRKWNWYNYHIFVL